jgi:hypothetical protein
MDMPDSASAAFEGLEIADHPWVAGGRVYSYIRLGDRETTLEACDNPHSVAVQTRVSKAYLALAALPLDEGHSFDLLTQAVEERDPYLIDVLTGWREYGETPRRLEILHRMGLELVGERLVVLGEGNQAATFARPWDKGVEPACGRMG